MYLVLLLPPIEPRSDDAVPQRRYEANNEGGEIAIGHLRSIFIRIQFPEFYHWLFVVARMAGQGKQHHAAHPLIGIPGMFRPNSLFRFSGKPVMFHVVYNLQDKFCEDSLPKKQYQT